MLTATAKSLQSCPNLCDPRDSSPPGSPIPGILQARTLEWVAISFSNAWKWKVKVESESEVPQSCPTLSDPTDCSLPGFSIHWICQARVQEWVSIAFSERCHSLGQYHTFFREVLSVLLQYCCGLFVLGQQWKKTGYEDSTSVAQMVKNLPVMQETRVHSLG